MSEGEKFRSVFDDGDEDQSNEDQSECKTPKNLSAGNLKTPFKDEVAENLSLPSSHSNVENNQFSEDDASRRNSKTEDDASRRNSKTEDDASRRNSKTEQAATADSSDEGSRRLSTSSDEDAGNVCTSRYNSDREGNFQKKQRDDLSPQHKSALCHESSASHHEAEEKMDIDVEPEAWRNSSDKLDDKEPGKVLGIRLDALQVVTKETCKKFYTAADQVLYNMAKTEKQDSMGKPNSKDFVVMPYMPSSGGFSLIPSSLWDSQISRRLKNFANGIAPEKFTHELEEMIMSYNRGQNWSFSGLRYFLENHHMGRGVVRRTIEAMSRLAVKLPELCPMPIPLLRKGFSGSITLSRLQIACLLANAFFCTYTTRNESTSYGKSWSKSSSVDASPVLPTINFSGLFQRQQGREKSVEGKLLCLFDYFDRITSIKEPKGCVTFERQICLHGPTWCYSRKHFTKLHVRRDGFIEDVGKGMLQVDFANKKIGGGVLGRGCVQEEIRFAICPELIVSRLFTEELSDNEALLITGCERYTNFKGYGRSFEYSGRCEDRTECDQYGRRLTQVVAIDALNFKNQWDQFRSKAIIRELNKAYCGFHNPRTQSGLPAVATGNWGCGAFGGDRHLKALIQLMAAAEAGRDVLYITIDDNKLVEELAAVHTFFVKKNLTVGDVFNMIENYAQNAYRRGHGNIDPLFDYLIETYKIPRIAESTYV